MQCRNCHRVAEFELHDQYVHPVDFFCAAPDCYKVYLNSVNYQSNLSIDCHGSSITHKNHTPLHIAEKIKKQDTKDDNFETSKFNAQEDAHDVRRFKHGVCIAVYDGHGGYQTPLALSQTKYTEENVKRALSSGRPDSAAAEIIALDSFMKSIADRGILPLLVEVTNRLEENENIVEDLYQYTRAIKNVFLEWDKKLMRSAILPKAQIPTLPQSHERIERKGGSTATVVSILQIKDRVFVRAAWVGDSRMVVFVQTENGTLRPVPEATTVDHDGNNNAEFYRVAVNGGVFDPKKRLTAPYLAPGFSVETTRSFGDTPLKYAVRKGQRIDEGSEPGQITVYTRSHALDAMVSSEPDVLEYELRKETGEIYYVLVASDGLWSNFSATAISDIVSDEIGDEDDKDLTAEKFVSLLKENISEQTDNGRRMKSGLKRDNLSIVVSRVIIS